MNKPKQAGASIQYMLILNLRVSGSTHRVKKRLKNDS
jgi:hypothetical protein